MTIPVIADRVKESSTTSGASTLTLLGAAPGFRSFASAMTTGAQCYYAVVDNTTGDWEVGIGTLISPTVLARNVTVYDSSNNGNLVSFGAAAKDVFITAPSKTIGPVIGMPVSGSAISKILHVDPNNLLAQSNVWLTSNNLGQPTLQIGTSNPYPGQQGIYLAGTNTWINDNLPIASILMEQTLDISTVFTLVGGTQHVVSSIVGQPTISTGTVNYSYYGLWMQTPTITGTGAAQNQVGVYVDQLPVPTSASFSALSFFGRNNFWISKRQFGLDGGVWMGDINDPARDLGDLNIRHDPNNGDYAELWQPSSNATFRLSAGANQSTQIEVQGNNTNAILFRTVSTEVARITTTGLSIGVQSTNGIDALQVQGAASLGNQANGQAFRVRSITELLTINASASTTTSMVIPSGTIVFGVSVFTTVSIPGAAVYTVTANTTGTTFSTAVVNTAAGTGNNGTNSCPYNNALMQSIRITPNTVPSNNSGRVRVTVHYYEIVAPTS